MGDEEGGWGWVAGSGRECCELVVVAGGGEAPTGGFTSEGCGHAERQRLEMGASKEGIF